MEDRKQARDKFNQADKLFREKNFADALVVLDELDKEFPDTKNVIYPRAMCLARVGRYDEALDLCRQLKVEFGDARGEKLMGKVSDLRKAEIAKENEKKQARTPGTSTGQSPTVYSLDSNPPPLEDRLKGKNLDFSPVFNPQQADPNLQARQPGLELLEGGADAFDLGDGSPVIDMAALDDLFAAKPTAPPPAVKPAPPSRKGIYIGAGIAAAVLIVLVALPLILGGGKGASEGPAVPPAPASGPEESDQPANPRFDGPAITWLSSIEEASSASGDYQDVLLLFYSSSASTPDLDLMETSVWNDPTIRYFAKNWVCAKIDVDADPEIKDMWEITTLPTTILTDYAFEEEYYRQDGLVDAGEFYTAMMDNGFVPDDTPLELPALPVIALALLPIVYIVATFLPVLFTLMLLGRMPEDDLATGVLGMILVGIVAPFLGMFVMRAAYHLGRIEMLLYYGLLAVHLFVANWIMTAASGMPFHVYLAGLFITARSL